VVYSLTADMYQLAVQSPVDSRTMTTDPDVLILSKHDSLDTAIITAAEGLKAHEGSGWPS